MEPLSPQEEKQKGLTRERLVAAALELIDDEGLEGLSMRSLAERLDVKAASLYWHVRDRRELLELLAASILEGVARPRGGRTWRTSVTAIAEAVARRVAAQKDAGRIVLEVREAVGRSEAFMAIRSQLVAAGLPEAEAADVALMLMAYVLAGPRPADVDDVQASGGVASIAVDSGSRGVVLHAGPADMGSLFRVPAGQAAAATAVQRGEQVVVRRLRGVGRGEIELNPRRAWRFKVQAPTWNTVLDATGLDVREVHIDSGAVNVECFLPRPRGVVPVHVSSGVVNVSVHRPQDVAATALLHTGAVKARLDDFSTKVAVFDVRWESPDAAGAQDRYAIDVSSGVVDFKLDTYRPKGDKRVEPVQAPPSPATPATALDVLLDGVEARVKAIRS